MSSEILTHPLGALRHAFESAGFDEHAFITVITGLIMVWRSNDLVEDLTREVIFSELDLDELSAQLFWNNVGSELTTVATLIRNFALQGKLIRWVVYPHTLLLELDSEILL